MNDKPSGEGVDVLAVHDALWRLFETVEAGTSQDYRALQETGLLRSLRRHTDARTAVAALIARNAELKAERDALAAWKMQAWQARDERDAETKRAAALITERDALAAENKALREDLFHIATANPKDWDVSVRDQFQEWAQSRARNALARTPAATGARHDPQQ